MLPTFAQLVQVVTSSNAVANILQIANSLGLSTTAWQPLGMARTIFTTISQVVSAASSYVNLVAQGGYATTASAMVDSNGNPITMWMDLVSYENYDNTRNPATPAEGVVAFGNITSTPRGPFGVGTLHLKHPLTGATYSNTLSTEQIYGTGTPGTPFYSLVHFEADVGGAASTAVPGTVLALTTPIVGVSVAPLGTNGSSSTLVGTNAESNPALLTRDLNKLGSIAPNGAEGALVYVATTQSIIANYGVVSAPITRAQDELDTLTGTVTLYLANEGGGVTSGDAAIVQIAEQALAVPTGMTLIATPATNQPIVVNATIYVVGPTTGVAAGGEIALVLYFGAIPINGINGALDGEVPVSGIQLALQFASPFITEIDVTSPASTVSIAIGAVPVLDPSSVITVVSVPPA